MEFQQQHRADAIMRPPQITTNRNEGGGQERLVSVSQKKRSDNTGGLNNSVKKRIIQNPVFEDNCRKVTDNSRKNLNHKRNFDGSTSHVTATATTTTKRKFPLSETEPLLSELTVSQQSTPARTIYLNKNSSTSLIFTKKDLATISETSITTASNNRKQHAYSWYAPVYSALEEEFEQDSKVCVLFFLHIFVLFVWMFTETSLYFEMFVNDLE